MPLLPPNPGWNGSFKFGSQKRRKNWDSTPNSSEPENFNPRCACGNPFPLDKHPTTNESICAVCYKKAISHGWVVDYQAQAVANGSSEIYHFYVEALDLVSACFKAEQLVDARNFVTSTFVHARSLEHYREEVGARFDPNANNYISNTI